MTFRSQSSSNERAITANLATTTDTLHVAPKPCAFCGGPIQRSSSNAVKTCSEYCRRTRNRLRVEARKHPTAASVRAAVAERRGARATAVRVDNGGRFRYRGRERRGRISALADAREKVEHAVIELGYALDAMAVAEAMPTETSAERRDRDQVIAHVFDKLGLGWRFVDGAFADSNRDVKPENVTL